MKKVFAFGLLIVLLLGLVGCEPIEEPKDPNDIFIGLVSLEDVTLEDETKIIAIRDQYEKLTSEEKSKITTANLEKLVELEARIDELKLEQAKEVEAEEFRLSVAQIPVINAISLADEAIIASVRSHYNSLASEIKSLVSEALTILEQAEAQLIILHEQDKQSQAQKIIDAILGLPALQELTIADTDLVENIIDEYEALPNGIQLLVDNSYLQTLMEYQNRLVDLFEIDNFVTALYTLPTINE
jgi:hypothetical protein